MLGVKFDTSVLDRKFTRLEKEQLPFAMALTLTWTARDMQTAIKREISDAFDRPTRYAIEGVFLRGATKRKLEAFVFLRNEATKGTPPSKFLVPSVYGGRRRAKRFERALRARGIIGPNELTVPSVVAKKDRFGNVPASEIVKMLSSLGANPDPLLNTPLGKYRRRGKKKVPWFVGTIGNAKHRAIFKTVGKSIEPVFFIMDESEVNYEKQFRFFEVGDEAFTRTFRKNWEAALAYAVKTAR